MSPLTLRRYRAEKLLRGQFAGLRGRVLASVAARLSASGARLDRSDLEACYAQAWQGLYAAMLAGQEIANPTAWLILVTLRRALDEHRSRVHAPAAMDEEVGEQAAEPDLAAALDDRVRLRQLVHGMRGRLDAREREAAALCYLQGLSRAQAAARMGISEARMRKLMEGRAGRPGVAGKVSALVATIRDGDWCEQQASLMRAFAYGILDPEGERYQLAVMHWRDCPACRRYVASLRGIAAVLPPTLAPLALAAGSGSAASGGAFAGGAHTGGALGAGGGAAGAGLGAPVGAKLALGCALALGLGAGCAALLHAPAGGGHRRAAIERRAAAAPAAIVVRPPAMTSAASRVATTPSRASRSAPREAVAAAPEPKPATPSVASVGREFTPEQPQASSPAPTASAAPTASVAAHVAASSRPTAAEREFSPG